MSEELYLRAIQDDRWELTRTLTVRGKMDTFSVPRRFVTDFASVPRILWPIFPPYGKYTRAAIVHDWLYSRQSWVLAHGPGRLSCKQLTRSDADGIFRRLMREEGVSAWKRWAMWLGVRLGGWYAWSQSH